MQLLVLLGPVGPRIVGPGCISGENILTFPSVSFLPKALSSNWILILIQLLQIKDRQNVTHKQTDTVSKVAHFS